MKGLKTGVTSLLQHLSILLVLLFSSAANLYFRSDYSNLHLLVVLTIVFFILPKQSFYLPKAFGNIIFFWIVYNVIYLVYYQVFSINSFFLTPVLLLIALIIININKERLLITISNTITYLALISLFFYAIQYINFQATASILRSIEAQLGIPGLGHTRTHVNVLFYTLSDAPSGIPGLRRNFGFMFEPGGFATMLSTGLFITLLVNGNKLFNPGSLIILIALITTFSTTGYIALIVIISYYLYINAKRKRYWLLFIPFVFMVSWMIQTEYIADKVYHHVEIGERVLERGAGMGSMGRFGGLYLNIEDWLKRPIFGHFFDREDRLTGSEIGIASINGLGNLLARHGVVIFMLFILGYWKTTLLLCQNKSGAVFFILVLLINAFAFNLIRSPFFVTFFLSGYIISQGFSFEKRPTS